jgi:DNA processing protein
MMTPQHVALLRLVRSDGVGPTTCHRLLARFGAPQAAIDNLQDFSKGKLRPAPQSMAEDEIAALTALGGAFLTILDDDYPVMLAATEDAPPVLALRGQRDLLKRQCLGMVGARNASLNGKKFAQKLAKDCGDAGLTVVSGLARGIDTAAHTGALATGTIAAVAGGVNVIYPPENRALTEQIAEQGLIVSEQPFGMQPIAQHFPRRNRIISGLSLGVVVVEASLQSGSLITARVAAEQGRDVFAVPGFPGDPRAQGPNRLLKDGAILVEGVADILPVLNAPFADLRRPAKMTAPQIEFPLIPMAENNAAPAETVHLKVTAALSPQPVMVDELASACQLSLTELQTVLLEMELAGRVRRLPGNRVCLLEDYG